MSHITLISSRERSGIRTYSETLAEALRALGHRVDHVGIGWWDSGQLIRESGRIPSASKVVIVEHEFALFRNLALAFAMLRLRLSGKRVVLSLHELEPDKFWNYHKIVAAIHYRMRSSVVLELLRIFWETAVLAQRMVRYRLMLWLLGAFAERIVIHSPRARQHIGLVTGDPSRVVEVPHFVEPLPGVSDPATLDEAARAARKRELRAKLGLPEDRFVFVSPGFIFRRKRLREVIDATPEDALLVIQGTESGPWDAGHLAELREHVASKGLQDRVRFDDDYDSMPDHMLAADAVVLFYERAFQSGIASHAIWAEVPCILSDDPSFRMYEGAALFARDGSELRKAMRDVRDPETRARLVARARELKRELAPEEMARRYLEGLAS